MAGIDLTPPPRFSPDAADVTGERWTAWKERFNFYLLAKDLTRAAGERKVAILLTCMGEEAMKLYGTFTFTPAVAANPDEGIEAVQGENRNDLETVLRKFDQHYGNKKYRNVRRQAFLNRKQGKDESIMDFIADLKPKINDCEYGEAANSILCDRIVQGIKNNHVKTRLLDLPDDELTVENAIKICRASELTSEQVRALGETEVKHARTFNGNRRGRGRAATWQRERSETHCDRCGRTHERYKCPAYNKFCGSCGQRGHFARSTICQARPQGHPPTRSRRRERKKAAQKLHHAKFKQTEIPCSRETSVLEDQYNSTTIIFLPKHLVMVVKSKAQPTWKIMLKSNWHIIWFLIHFNTDLCCISTVLSAHLWFFFFLKERMARIITM